MNPADIARSLIILMLIPLGIGLLVKARYGEIAATWQPHMARPLPLACWPYSC